MPTYDFFLNRWVVNNALHAWGGMILRGCIRALSPPLPMCGHKGLFCIVF